MESTQGIKFYTKRHMGVVVIAVILKPGSLKVFVNSTLAKYKTFLLIKSKSKSSPKFSKTYFISTTS
jgi:hypothetical protein